MSDLYDDILDRPYPFPSRHPRMTQHDRAAQFAPFAALTGYHERIRSLEKEKAVRPVLDDQQEAKLNRQLQELQEKLREKPHVTISCFRPDSAGTDAAIKKIAGEVEHIDIEMRLLKMRGGLCFSLDDILAIES